MSSPVPNSTVAPASTATTVPAATTTKKPASLKAVTGFGQLDPNALANTAHNVATKIGGSPGYFPNPPVDPAALNASANALSEPVISPMHGGKPAKALFKNQPNPT